MKVCRWESEKVSQDKDVGSSLSTLTPVAPLGFLLVDWFVSSLVN